MVGVEFPTRRLLVGWKGEGVAVDVLGEVSELVFSSDVSCFVGALE